jgi:hypothetical protein
MYLVYIIDHIHHFFMNLKTQLLLIYKTEESTQQE